MSSLPKPDHFQHLDGLFAAGLGRADPVRQKRLFQGRGDRPSGIQGTERVLKNRLHTRNTDDPKEIERRLANARGEIDQLKMYQYAVVNVNGDPSVAYEQVKTIIAAEKQRTTRYFPVVE